MEPTPAAGGALAHVDNRYYDGPHYDQRYFDYTRDISFWTSFAELVGGDVLELAAGTGRLGLPMAERGLSVVGLDISPSMLARARQKAKAAFRRSDSRTVSTGAPEFVLGDMRDFDLGRRFGLVLLACSSVCHLLSDVDAERCFTAARRHLRPGGVFALDVAAPQHETSTADGVWRPRFHYPDPSAPGEVSVAGRRSYEPAGRILTDELDYTFTVDGRVERAIRTSRMYPAAELEALLVRSGFALVTTYGGFDRRALTADCDTQILIAAAEGHERP
jgi:SAM-dependent methyltransferase